MVHWMDIIGKMSSNANIWHKAFQLTFVTWSVWSAHEQWSQDFKIVNDNWFGFKCCKLSTFQNITKIPYTNYFN